jgi:DNA-binding transcriptional ArsR family regulator
MDASGDDALAARVAALERRLDAVDSATPAAPPPRVPDDTRAAPDPEVFWALDGLRSRAGPQSAVLFTGAVTLPDAQTYQWQQGADAEALLDADWDSAAEPLSALGHPVRLAVLRQVLAGRRTTAEIGALDQIGTTGQLYHHLRQLTAAGWLRSSGRGRYEVPATRVVPLLVILTAAQL